MAPHALALRGSKGMRTTEDTSRQGAPDATQRTWGFGGGGLIFIRLLAASMMEDGGALGRWMLSSSLAAGLFYPLCSWLKSLPQVTTYF